MKFAKFLIVPALALLLASCNRPTPTPASSSEPAPSSETPAPSSEQPTPSSQTPASSQAPASSQTPASSETPAPSSELPSSQAPSSSTVRQDFWIRVYLDYNHFEESEPILKVMWEFDRPFTKEDIGLVDPTEVPDPYYSTFLGWSTHPIVDEEQYLWKFGKDVVTKEMAVGYYINLYGIFVRA